MTRQPRKIVHIDENKCDGCGLCVPSCAEGAIRVVDGKARLVAENLCDGIGNCLGTCPKGAIRIEERPADAFDERAVREHIASEEPGEPQPALAGECPNRLLKMLNEDSAPQATGEGRRPGSAAGMLRPAQAPQRVDPARSRLGQWPVQLSLLPESGTLWQDADLLLAADCTAYAMGGFHESLLDGKTLAVACPKLDDVTPYIAKLARIFSTNDIGSITVARMEVPCCMGLTRMVRQALQMAGRDSMDVREVVVSIHGEISSD